MWNLTLPFDDWMVQLNPRFDQYGLTGQIAVLLALLLVPLLLLGLLYRYELRLVNSLSALALLGLRLLLVVVLWFVIAFQPVLATNILERIPSRVILAIDHSGSMGIPDPQRAPAEKLLLAKALGMTGPQEIDLLQSWVQQYQTGKERSELTWLTTTETTLSQNARESLTLVRRKRHDQLLAQIDSLKRAEIIRRLLSSQGKKILDRLGKDHQVEIVAFDDKAWRIAPGNPESILQQTPSPSARTDLRQPLTRILEDSDNSNGKILGVLLFSDGSHLTSESPIPKAREMGESGLKVYPVAIAGKGTPPDLNITMVRAPTNVYKGAEATVEAQIKVAGIPAQKLQVDLFLDGKLDEKQSKSIQHDGSDRSYNFQFPVLMKEPGTKHVEVRITPTKKDTIEISRENNHRAAVVRVAADEARVLVIDGEARWEYHYLAAALKRDPGLKVESVVFLQPRIGKLDEETLEQVNHPRLYLPTWKSEDKKTDPLVNFECIVVGDVSPEQLPLADRRRLESYVADHGGTLILIAGKRWLPLAYQDGDKSGNGDPLLKMLPLEQIHSLSTKNGFHIGLTREGRNTAYLNLEPDPAKNRNPWEDFPPHFWAVTGKPKPGATPLATAIPPEEDSSLPGSPLERTVLATQAYGFGRVLFVGLDSTWRWRFRRGDLYHHRFWGQLMRWAAADRLLPAGNSMVRYGTRQAVHEMGEDVQLLVRMEEHAPPLHTKNKHRALLFRQNPSGKEEQVAEVELRVDRMPSQMLKGKVRGLGPGTYRIQLAIPELDGKIPNSKQVENSQENGATFTVLPPNNAEMLQLAANYDLLKTLARSSGGQLIEPDELDGLLQTWKREIINREEHRELKTWQDQPLTWYFLGLFLSLLTCEWILRKFANLP